MNLLNPSDVAALLSSEFCVRLTQALAHFLWQGFSIGIAVWMVDRLLPRTSSRFRYSAGVAALVTMLACVPLTYVALGFFPGNSPAQTAGDVSVPADRATAESRFAGGTAISALPVDASVTSIRPADNVDRAVPTSATGNQPNLWFWQSLHSLLTRLAPYATLAYLLGVAIMLARLALALRGSHALRQSAAPLADPAILAMAVRQARRIGLKVVPAIAWCQRAAVPLVVGIVRPMILLPTAIAGGVSPDQLEALLAHELAHLKRLDLAVNLVQRLAESVLFFHPAVWYVSRRISIERENCCDDCVLAAGWGRVEYADALVRMAEVCATARGLAGLEGAALLAASGETPSQFKRRVLRLLDAQDHLRVGISRGWLLAAVGAMVLALAAIPLAIGRKDKAAAGQPEKAQTADAEALPEEAPLPDVHASLRFLASRQNDDGSFGSGDFPLDRSPALTAICGLALVRGDIITDAGRQKAAGFIPAKYPRYRDKAIAYVLKQQRDSGLLAGADQPSQSLMYNHAYSMWFLAEAAAAGSKVAVKEPLQKAVALTVGAQNQEGGWRYLPKPDDADAHVTAVQLLALAAARRARIEVPPEVIDKAVGYLRRCRDEPSGGFTYQPGLKPTSFSRSALVLAAIVSAKENNGEGLKSGFDYLARQAGQPREFDPELYAGDGRWLALLALCRSAGYDRQWRQLDRQFRAELLRERQPEGSWHEPKVGPERATALACLLLLVPPPAANAVGESAPEERAKEKLYLRGQEAVDRIEQVKPAWSETQQGVQFGIAIVRDQRQFHIDQRVPLEMFVRNVGNKEASVSLAADFVGNVPEIKNAAGEVIPIERILLSGTVPLYRESLKPDEAFGFRHLGVGLGPRTWPPHWDEPKPGKYTLRHTPEIIVEPADETAPSQRVKFTSGAVEFEVVDGAASDRRPTADEAKRAVQAAQLDRRKYLETTLPNDERLIKSEVSVAEKKRSQAQESLDFTKRLAAKGLATRLQLDAAEVALKQAQLELDKTQSKLDVLRNFTKAKTLLELDRKVVSAIETLLDQGAALKVTGRPLIEVLDNLEKAHGIPVTIDLKEVRARGATIHAQVTINVTDKPLKEVFKAVLTSAGLDFDVTAEGVHVPAKAQREGGAPPDEAAKPAPFKPFECQIVDAVTGKPIQDVTVSFRYQTLATKDAPEETVANLIYTNVGASQFIFLIPDQAIGRPELVIQWGAGHPDYEPYTPEARVPLAHILADDPKSARDTFRIIKLQPKKKDAPPQEDNASSTRIHVKYDVPGAEEEGQIFVQHIGGRDIIGTGGSPQLPTNPVKKGETLELKDLDPGDYQVARHRMIRIGDMGMSRFIDRQRFKLKTGETKTIDFTRANGKAVSGTVLGLKEAGLATAVVNVCSENAKVDRPIGDLEVTVFDARLCAADGTFKTEQLAPGRYTIVVEGYVPLTPEQRVQTGIIRPSYLAVTRVTVPNKGEAPKVEVKLEDAEKVREAAKKAGARLEIHYDIPGAEERGRFVVEGPNGSIGPEKIGMLFVNYVNRGQTLTLESLPEGNYQVTRYRTLMMEPAFGVSRYLDGRQFELHDGDSQTLAFTRPGGKSVAGKILGLEGKGINKVLVNVCSGNVESRESLRQVETTIFDALLAKDDGTFQTEPLAPGSYTIVAEAYLPLTPLARASTGVIEPRYVGVAKLTVPESGETPTVEVRLKDAKQVEGADAAEQAQKWGDLTVQFVYDGPRPEPKKFENTRDVALFGREIPDQSLIVGDKGGLANVAVFVTSAEVPVHPEERKRAERTVEMRTVDGQLVPRVVPLMVRQKLKLINDTPVAFNFKAAGQRNSGFNVLVAPRDSFQAEFPTAERMPAQITDGIHTWIQAFVLPLDHPYAAASGADGIARLSNLPEGEWTFRFWHEKGGFLKSAEKGDREFKIKIKPGVNRLPLRVSPEFTVQAAAPAAGEPSAPPADRARGAVLDPPEPDASVNQALKRAGVSLRIDAEGRVTEIYLGPTASDDLLQQIGRLPNLKKLHIELARQLTGKGFEHLSGLSALESLGLFDVPLPKEGVANLARIRSLTELSLVECGLTDADIGPLTVCTGLKSLSLRGNAITDAGLDSVVELTNLEVLELANTSSVGSEMQITDRGLAKLAALKRLKQLNLSSTRLPLGFTDKGLVHLSAYPDLESLHVSGFDLSDEALVYIGRCTNLRRLGLHFGGFTDNGMKEIRNLTKLKSISISSGQLTEAGLLHLGGLPSLEFAELRTSGVTDRVMEELSQIKSLARLDLYANSRPGVSQSPPPFTGAGLAHFKGHAVLRTLWLTNVEIDQSMLAALKELKQLGELILMMPRLSDDAVRELQAALPTTRVHAVWGGHSIAPLQDQPRKRPATRSER